MSTLNVLVDVALAAAFFFAVNALGKGAEGLGYTTFLANLEQSSFGFNAAFRVFAPAVMTGLAAIVLYVLGLDQLVLGIWLVAPLYWIFRWLYYLSRSWFALIPRSIFAMQALTSIALTYYFYVNGYSKGIASILPASGDVTFQFWLIALGFAYLWASNNAPTQAIAESKRRELRRRHDRMRAAYDRLLRSRFQQDNVLRVIFYTIMLVEDFNRGPHWRIVENVLVRFGMARTTGIMQVTSDKVLSDEASVVAAQEIVAELWDDTVSEKMGEFISLYATDGELDPPITSLSPNSYEFSYDRMITFAGIELSDLYLGYSGNRFDDLDDFFDVVLDAESQILAQGADIIVKVELAQSPTADTHEAVPALEAINDDDALGDYA